MLWQSLHGACSSARRHRPRNLRPAWPVNPQWSAGCQPLHRHGPKRFHPCPVFAVKARAPQRHGHEPKHLLDQANCLSLQSPQPRVLNSKRQDSNVSSLLAICTYSAAHKKETTASTWSAAIKVGAWPTPANSTKRAWGPRSVIRLAVSVDSKSESAPRTNKVCAVIAS